MSLDSPAKIVVLGAGPIGLEAALYARYLGYEVEIFERGRIADSVLAWGHVRMFTPFGRNRSPLGLAALRAQDPAWQAPADDALLTGRQWAEQYLIPLAKSDLLVDGLHEQTEVIAVGRAGPLKDELVGDEARIDTDLRVLVRDAGGAERSVLADAVIDATGTYGNPRWLGDGGIPALGEQAASAEIEYGLPDFRGPAGERYAGRHTLVVGCGHSAATNVLALSELAHQVPNTWITWITRRGPLATADDGPVRIVPADPFPERDRIARAANRLATGGSDHVTHYPDSTVESIVWHSDLSRFVVRLTSAGTPRDLEVDRVIANVGCRPDRRLYAELQVDECYATEAPRALGRWLAENKHLDEPDLSRLDPAALVQPEPDFYVLGSKSFGRDPRFFVSAGLEQIRQLFAVIGDRADLDLYATAGLLR